MITPLYILYVALGGALGSVLRYVTINFAGRYLGQEFPYGTLIVNVSGSFIMGLFIALMARFIPARAEDIRVIFAIGVLGGYTTFSSFSLDAIALLQRGQIITMGLYIILSVVCSLAGLLAGQQLIRAIA